MAPPYRSNGGSHQNRRYQLAGYDRPVRGAPHRQQEFHRQFENRQSEHRQSEHHQSDYNPSHGIQAPLSYIPQRLQQPIMSAMPPNPQMVDPHRFLYPSGIPADYRMVDPGDNSIPRQFIDTLDKPFYSTPAKEVRATFSTDDGKLPVRYMSAHTIILERKMDLWSADEIQTRANSIRKKFWYVMKNMPKPICWEDLYDYFDIVEIYQHGPLNLWNLITHLHHENQQLLKNMHNELAFVTGLWCDEWVAKEDNKQKLRQFRNWDQVLAIFDKEDLKEMQGMEPNKVEILKLALIHRQAQLNRQDRMQPSPYPINSLQFQWEQNTVQNWLSDQIVPDTPSGLMPLEALASSAWRSGLGSIAESPTKSAKPPRAPLVVRGTTQPNGWERVQDDAIHGPVFRRSPKKEGTQSHAFPPSPIKESGRSRAFSRSSATSKEDLRPRTFSQSSLNFPDQQPLSSQAANDPLMPSIEAEAQSKPPSEEVLPDEPSARKPQQVEGAGKTIKVHLPTTPPKEKANSNAVAVRSPTPEKTIKHGVYRKAYTEANAERISLNDFAPSQSILSREEAGRQLDAFLDVSLDHTKGTIAILANDKDKDKDTDNDKKSKSKKSKSKKKKTSLPVSQETRPDVSECEVTSTVTMNFPGVTEFVMTGLEAAALESQTHGVKSYSANGGNSLRVSKTRRKQGLGIEVADSTDLSRDAVTSGGSVPQTATSIITAKDSSSNGSQGILTPATPSSEQTTPRHTPPKKAVMALDAASTAVLLNPEAKEFVSPGDPGKRTSTVPLVKLAPIPLKPVQHKRGPSQSSNATSHTLTPGSTPKKFNSTKDGNDSVDDDLKVSAKDTSQEKKSNAVPISNGNQSAPETADDVGTWEKPRQKRNFTKVNFNQGKNQSQHFHNKQGRNKNRQSPKKQKLQGQNHTLATPAPSGLPASSNWAATARSGTWRSEEDRGQQ